MIWHGHIPKRTIIGVEAHVHWIHYDGRLPSIAVGCDVGEGWKGISAKDSWMMDEIRVPSRTKLTGNDEEREERFMVRD